MSTSENSTSTKGSHYQPSTPVVATILVAFLVLSFVLVRGISSNAASTASAPAQHHQQGGGATTPTTTVPAIHVPLSQVSVQVANGTNIHGLGKNCTQRLQTLGWDTLTAVNGPHGAATVIYYKPGFGWAAAEIAGTLKVPATAARPVGAFAGVAGAQGDDIVVVLGPDVGS